MKNFNLNFSTFLILILSPWLTIQFLEDDTHVRCHLNLNSIMCSKKTSSWKSGFNFSETPHTTQHLEIDCKDKLVDFLSPDGLVNLTSLSNLTIINCPSLRLIEELDLPQETLTCLKLRDNKLTGEIFRKIKHSNSVQILDLSFNEIKTLDFEFLSFPNLNKLVLLFNSIQNISSKSFKNCYRLARINLSHNKISTLINKNEFGNFTNIFHSEYLPNLRALYLVDNAIHHLDCSMIPKSVVTLSLLGNPLKKFSCNEPHLTSRVKQDLIADWSLLDSSTIFFPPLASLRLLKIIISRFPEKLFSQLLKFRKHQLERYYLFVVERFNFSSYNNVIHGVKIYIDANCDQGQVTYIHKSQDPPLNYIPPLQEIKALPVHNNNSTVFCQFIQNCSPAECYDLCIPKKIKKGRLDCGNLMLTDVPKSLPNNSKELYLDGNNLTSVKLQQILTDFPYLEALYLNNSNIHEIKVNEPKKRDKPLKQLHLENNFIHNFSACLLIYLGHLKSIHLQNNSLTEFHMELVSALYLDNLHLEHNNISKFYIGRERPFYVTNVYLQYNKISKIERRFCIYLFNVLYLDNNEITEVELDCEKLLIKEVSNKIRDTSNKLEKLFLRNNYLTVLKPFSFSTLEDLQELHLEGNRIEHLEKNCFYDLPRLRKLYFQRNKLKAILQEMLPPVYEVDIPYYKFELNKRKFYSSDVRTNFTKIDEGKVSTDEYFIKLYSFEIDFEGNSIERIDLSIFNMLSSLVTIQLKNNSLREISCDYPLSLPFLKEIHLEENRLKSLSGNVFKGLTKVRKLYLHQNELFLINKDTFKDMTSLEVLTLHGNKFQRLEILQFVFSSNFKQLTIHENPITCDCKYLADLTGVFKTVDFISNVSQMKCLSSESKNYLLEVYLIQFCNYKEMIIGLSALIGLLLLTGSIGVLLYRYRLEIQVILYSRFGVRFFHDQSLDERKAFHAFIAYSCDDSEFVAKQLLPGLEEYRLCLHDRNFVVGAFIQENIVNAVNHSACTVVVFSRSFVKSPWCRFEFRTAHDKFLKKGCRPIIVIVLQDVPQDDMEEEMKVYLSTSTYLRWGDQLFWEKLYFVLPSLHENDNDRNNQEPIPLQEFEC